MGGWPALLYGFGIGVLAILLLGPLCVRFDHVDKPGGRKIHRLPTPLSGGIAIVGCVLLVGIWIMPLQRFAGLIFGTLVLAGLGALDDRRPVSPVLRLSLQILAVGIGMCAIGGIRLVGLGQLFGPQDVLLGAFATGFTIVAVVGIINAVNMIDGMDGIAGSFTVAIMGLLLVLGATSDNVNTGLLCLVIGSVAAFLMFNLRAPWQQQARCFLGDAGSNVLGFVLSWFVIAASQGDAAVFDPITAVWLFGLPIVDTNYLMGSRIKRSKSPLEADNRHFHHLLQASGLTPQRALCAWLATAAGFMAIGVAGELLQVAQGLRLLLFVLTFALYCFVVDRLWQRRLSREKSDRASAHPFDGSLHDQPGQHAD